MDKRDKKHTDKYAVPGDKNLDPETAFGEFSETEGKPSAGRPSGTKENTKTTKDGNKGRS